MAVARVVPFIAFTVACLINSPSAMCQAVEDRLTYDIVSIHPSRPDAVAGGVDPLPSGTGYKAEATTVKSMISVMYRIPLRQIIGGPDWFADQKFDVDAITDEPHTTDELHLMFQELLADRFHFKMHTETRSGRIYALSIAKSGMKMTPSNEVQDHNIPITNGSNNQFVGSSVRMNFFCWWLGLRLQNDERPVVDETGLTGAYDFRLSFRPQLPPDGAADSQDDRPSIFDALKNQLGLTLIPKTGPVEYLVVDSIAKPTAN